MVNEPTKRLSFPHTVAATMKRQLDRQQDGEIGYTIQQVSRYRLEDIQDAFKPLSPDLAQWFKRMAKDNSSPGFAIKEMDRIVSYTDMIWPEMKAAINECKDQILPMILELIRDRHEEAAGRYVKILKNLEVTWPELRIISGSLLESNDTSDLRNEGRQMLIDLMKKKAEEGQRGIFYMMYYLDDWGLHLRDWPEIRSIIDGRKDFLIREMLKGLTVPTDMDHAMEYAGFMVKRMKKIGVEWPELNVIEKSVDPKRLRENDQPKRDPSFYDDTMDDFSEEEKQHLVKHFPNAILRLTNPSEAVQMISVTRLPTAIQYIKNPTKAVQITAIGQNAHVIKHIKAPSDEMIRLALKKSPMVIRDFDDPSEWMQLYVVERYPELIGRIKNPTLSTQVVALTKEPALLSGRQTVDPGIWANDEVKDSIMRCVLTNIRTNMPLALGMARVMLKTNCPWPEFKTILRSLQADYPDLKPPDDEVDADYYDADYDPDDGRGDYEYELHRDRDLEEARGETPEQVIMRHFKHSTLHGLRYMNIYGRTVRNMPEAGVAIDSRKDLMIRRMINLLKQEDAESLDEMINLFRAAGVTWSELDVIEKSFRAEYLPDSDLREAMDDDDEEEHDGEDFEYTKAWRAKLEYQEFLKDLRHDIETQSWDLAALDLIDIGMTEIEDVLPDRTRQMIEQNKDNLIRGILERMRVGRYMELTIHAVDGLNNMGFNWPELRVIRNSLESDSKEVRS